MEYVMHAVPCFSYRDNDEIECQIEDAQLVRHTCCGYLELDFMLDIISNLFCFVLFYAHRNANLMRTHLERMMSNASLKFQASVTISNSNVKLIRIARLTAQVLDWMARYQPSTLLGSKRFSLHGSQVIDDPEERLLFYSYLFIAILIRSGQYK